jgi:hypothetical protein
MRPGALVGCWIEPGSRVSSRPAQIPATHGPARASGPVHRAGESPRAVRPSLGIDRLVRERRPQRPVVVASAMVIVSTPRQDTRFRDRSAAKRTDGVAGRPLCHGGITPFAARCQWHWHLPEQRWPKPLKCLHRPHRAIAHSPPSIPTTQSGHAATAARRSVPSAMPNTVQLHSH